MGGGANEDWFRLIWDSLTDEERAPIQHKAQWEHMSLRAVLIDWPSYVPERLGYVIVPRPNRDP
jgi:hypothetical protein